MASPGAYRRGISRVTRLSIARQNDLVTASADYRFGMTGSTLDMSGAPERDMYEDVMGRPTFAGHAFEPDDVTRLSNLNQGGRLDFNQLLTPLVSGVGRKGYALGPAPNTFGDSSTTDRTAAEALRDATGGAGANTATYTSQPNSLIKLAWSSGGEAYQRYTGSAWVDVTYDATEDADNIGATVSTPGSASATRLWEWEPNHDRALPIEYLSAAWEEASADGTKNHKRAARGFCTSLSFGRPTAGNCTMEAQYQFGRTRDRQAAPTGLPTVPGIIAVPAKVAGFSIFDTFAEARAAVQPGGTLAAADVSDYMFTLGTGHAMTDVMTENQDLDYVEEDAGPRAYTVSGNMYADVDSDGLSESEKMKKSDPNSANRTRFFAARLRSPKLIETVGGTSYYYELRCVLAGVYTNESFEGRATYDDAGRRKLAFEASCILDATSGKEFYLAMQTKNRDDFY